MVDTVDLSDAAVIIVETTDRWLAANGTPVPHHNPRRLYLPCCLEVRYEHDGTGVVITVYDRTFRVEPQVRRGAELDAEQYTAAVLRRVFERLDGAQYTAINDHIDGAGKVAVGTAGTVGINYGIR